MAEMILWGNWEPEVVLGETQAEQAGDTGRVAGPVRTEVPFSQLLFELALVILCKYLPILCQHSTWTYKET